MTLLRKFPVPLPSRMAGLPIDARGYPVPWFVAWLDDENRPVPRGEGRPEFRVITTDALEDAVRFSLCWICGDRLGAHKTFTIGPMCAVNRVSSEPPSHLACSEFAAKVCPFLSNPTMRRRENNLPDNTSSAGMMIRRNPQVTLVWTTKSYTKFNAGNGFLFRIGEPTSLSWWREGRTATRAEVLESIETGLPLLRAQTISTKDSGELDRMVAVAMKLVPGEAA